MLLSALAPCSLFRHTMATLVASYVFSSAPSQMGAAATVRDLPVASAPQFTTPSRCLAATGHPLFFRRSQSCRTTQRRPRTPPLLPPDTRRGGAIRRGPFPIFLMDIAQSDDADRLVRELDMLKDDAVEAVDEAIRATDPASADLCDALRWTVADGGV